MSAILIHQGDANQNDSEIPHTPIRMANIKNMATVHDRQDVEQGEHSPIVGGSANLYSHHGNQHGDFSEKWELNYQKNKLCYLQL